MFRGKLFHSVGTAAKDLLLKYSNWHLGGVSKYNWKGFNHFVLWVFVVFSDDGSKVAVNVTWHSPHSHILQKLASE